VFPPGKDVQIEVTYTAQGYGEVPNVAYKYILETGAGWKDTIGSADLVVRLPYEANNLNVFLDETTGYSMTSPNFTITGNELRWHYDNLEPTAADNLQVSLVVPQAWQAVLKEKAALLQNPKDGEAWGRLGKAYKEIVKLKRGLRQDAGGLELYQLSLEAYTKSLSFLPKDGLWHLGLADLLWNHYYWHVYWPGNPDPAELVRTVQELKLSLEFAPKNQKALDLLQEINQSIPGVLQSIDDGSYNYLILTGTPAVTPPYVPTTATATVTVSPVPLVVPSSTLTPELPADILIKPTAVPTQEQEATPVAVETTPQKTPARSPLLPVCGGGLMIPLGAAAAAIRAKMRLKGSAKNK
jgi:tetratricopeptide (TPR) repeat protein